MHSHINFGYPWLLTYAHLLIALTALALWLLGRRLHWSRLLLLPIAAVTLWSFAAFLVVRFGLDINGRLPLPTPSFLASGSGKVLDMGAGSGRSSIMVLEGRPRTTVVALDKFGTEYVRHFGAGESGEEVIDVGRRRLLANFRAAGVEQRASIQPGDMRKLPFDAATFDAVVSTYAIDHLDRGGVASALNEASRVLKPGGQFLLMVIAKDFWVNFTFGPLLLHVHTRSAARWVDLLHDAGFETIEKGRRPGAFYFLARKS